MSETWVPKRGDLVRRVMKYCDGDRTPRRVVKVMESYCDGGYLVWTDDGGKCKACHKPLAASLDGYAIAHFEPARKRRKP